MDYKAFHKLSYGLYIIATKASGKKAGYIGNTVFQVTSKPPRIAISCHKSNYTTGKIMESQIFSVSVLKKEADTSLIGSFGFMSSDETDKFEQVETTTAETGAPVVLDGSVAWLDCRVVSTHDVGSHLIMIGEVQESGIIAEEDPLTYEHYREKYKMLAPQNAPTYIEKEKLESEGKGKPEAENTPEPEAKEEQQEQAAPYVCTICGYEYNPAEGDPTAGIPPGTPFGDLPEDYKCPICNAGKEYFRENG